MILTPHFLEAINGTLVVIFLGLEFFFARYILLAFIDNFRNRNGAMSALVCAYRARRAAIAIFLMVAGDTVIRGHVWAWRHFHLPDDSGLVAIGTSIGVCLCIIGGTCALRHFAPDEWGRWPWIMIPLIGIMFGIAMAI